MTWSCNSASSSYHMFPSVERNNNPSVVCAWSRDAENNKPQQAVRNNGNFINCGIRLIT